MTNLNVLLSSVLKKLGVDISTSKAQELLGNSALTTIQVDDSISNQLNKDFYTLDSALQNPEILSKARAEALNGVDTHLESIWDSSGLDSDTITALKAEKKSMVKISKTVELIRAKEQKALQATGEDKQKLVGEINKLQNDIIQSKKEFDSKISEIESGRKLDKINWELDGVYGTFDYTTPIEKSLAVHSAKAVIAKITADKGIKFEMSDGGLVLKTKMDTDYVEDNIKLTPKDFITKTLIENKFIKVSGSGDSRVNNNNNGNQNQNNNQNNNNQNNNTHHSVNGNGSGEKKDNAYLRSLRKDIEAAPLPTNHQ